MRVVTASSQGVQRQHSPDSVATWFSFKKRLNAAHHCAYAMPHGEVNAEKEPGRVAHPPGPGSLRHRVGPDLLCEEMKVWF